MAALAGFLPVVQAGYNGGIQRARGGVIADARYRERRRTALVVWYLHQPRARPVGRDVEARFGRLGPIGAIASDICVDQARVYRTHFLVGQSQPLPHLGRIVGHEHVSPPDQPAQDFLRRGVLEIEREATLISIGYLPGLVVLANGIRW